MRALIVADIHSNLEALLAVLEDARSRGGFDELWCMGDVVGYGPNPAECIEMLRSHDATCVAGNHDLAAVGKLSTATFNDNAARAAIWTGKQLSSDDATFLSTLPQVAYRGDFTIVHGSLRDPVWECLVSDPAARGTFELLDTRFCLVGHSHLPFVRREGLDFEQFPEDTPVNISKGDDGERIIINPGGVGQPRDGDPKPSYAIYDGDRATLQRHRVTYDITITQEKMRDADLPEPLIIRLNFGR